MSSPAMSCGSQGYGNRGSKLEDQREPVLEAKLEEWVDEGGEECLRTTEVDCS